MDQSDLDIFLQFLQLARGQPVGKGLSGEPSIRISFPVRDLLKETGRHDGKGDRDWLLSVIWRLACQFVSVEAKGVEATGEFGLVQAFLPGDDPGFMSIFLSPSLIPLLARGHVRVDRAVRLALFNRPIAKWLHVMLSSDVVNMEASVSSLQRQCGSKASTVREFRRSLRSAVEALKDAGAIDDGAITPDDTLKVSRAPSAAQKKWAQGQPSSEFRTAPAQVRKARFRRARAAWQKSRQRAAGSEP